MSGTLFTIIGYFVFIIYTCGIMGLGALLEKKTGINKTICRKITHIISALVWVICYFFFGCSVHWVILNGIGAVALGIITFGGFLKTYDREDADKSYGLFFIGLGTFITASICYFFDSDLYLYTGIAYYCLVLGDGLAPLVAMLLKKHNPCIMEGRSLCGSLTVFVVSFLSTLLFSHIFGMQLDLLYVFSVAALTCIAEFYGLKGFDNLFIEFAVFGYLMLGHYGKVTLPLEIAVLTSPFIAFCAIGSKSLSVSGGISALLFFYAVAYFGKGAVPLLFTVMFFAVATVVSFVTHKLYNKNNNVNAAKHVRTGKQIVAVGAAAVICLIVYYFTDRPFFYCLFFLSLTEQFADSLASDVGRLTRGKNIDIIKFKSVEKGLSGGVSALGTLCALIGCVGLLLVPLLFNIVAVKYFLLLAAIAFVGTLIDSVFGSLLQSLYECNVCGIKTEDQTHCECPTRRIKGFSLVDNTMVNFLTSIVTCGAGCLLLLL